MEKLLNSASSTLVNSITNVATSCDVHNATSFLPGSAGSFALLVDGELMKVTAIAGNTLTVERGAEGTTAAAHAANATCVAVITARALADYIAEQATITVSANKVLVSDGAGHPTASAVPSATLDFLDATSSVQAQLDNKAATSSLGTAAALDVGVSANKVVQLDGDAKLPAVDGSQLTNLPSISPLGFFSTWTYTESPEHLWELPAGKCYYDSEMKWLYFNRRDANGVDINENLITAAHAGYDGVHATAIKMVNGEREDSNNFDADVSQYGEDAWILVLQNGNVGIGPHDGDEIVIGFFPLPIPATPRAEVLDPEEGTLDGKRYKLVAAYEEVEWEPDLPQLPDYDGEFKLVVVDGVATWVEIES